MFCKHCGKEIDDRAVVCIHCGVPTSDSFGKPAAAAPQTNTLALIGFILSFFISIAGLICSIMGYKNSKNMDGAGRGFALAGIIISAVSMGIGLITGIFVIVFYLGFLSYIFDSTYYSAALAIVTAL